jgi:polyvinyl alcohol dehydrogenase (cytochrome)
MIDSILAIDAASGELRWHYAAEQRDVWHNGVANPDREGGYTDKDFSDSPKLYDLPGIGRVVGAGQKSGDYHVLDAYSGELLSRTPHLRQTGALGGFQYLGAVADGVVYQHGLDRMSEDGSGGRRGRGGFQGTVLALSGDGSEVKWRFDRPGSMLLGGLAVAGAALFVQSPSEAEQVGDPRQWALYALDVSDGQVLARVTFEGVAVSNPSVSRSRVYIGGGNSAVGRFIGPESDGRLIALQIP